ncbi:Bromodomain-containing protein 4B [Sesamum alatum]|uniref:Bromodomain-containing protein 4B n=1 Tax=Sesamum alatum TaxID=300844 RepID=A0AAE1YXP2_9LAMI|nr:Bromodomain-containing protein 4B [Sesamum alatum]
MKRRRGNKKGRAKKPKLVSTNEVASNVVSLNTEENSGLDEFDNEEVDSGMDAETEATPSPSGTSQPEVLANANSVGRPINSTFGKAVYTRVKVKIKTSKNLESQHTSSDAPTQSDTDKSSQQVGSEKQGAPNEKMEDSANSLSETNGGVPGNTSKKSIGIKIKSSRGLGSSSMSPCSNTEPVKADRTEKKDAESHHQESRYNEQELKASLEVIRKIMKMDAAEPFNVPVNPVALGIPDYFDVIDTPMDFGTICSNLEKGVKYKNSEDVFKDVQYIWDNCYKYNNKGDYIVELMKRVKKNFAKYWTAAGLFNDQPQETSGLEGNPVADLTPSSDGNTPVNGGALNLSGKKFHGLKKHKEGCQCAICVMMRRRQEREEIARMMGGQTEGSEDSQGEDMKPEGIAHGESPFGEYASSNIENSPEADADIERKGQEMKLGHIRNFYAQQNGDDAKLAGKQEGSQDLQLSHRSGDENGVHYQTPHSGSGGSKSNETQKEMSKQNEDGSAAGDQQKSKGLLDKNQRAKMLENLRYLENPMLLELYGTLFADNSRSFWNGPHSLVDHNRGSKRRSSLHSAISSFMK